LLKSAFPADAPSGQSAGGGASGQIIDGSSEGQGLAVLSTSSCSQEAAKIRIAAAGKKYVSFFIVLSVEEFIKCQREVVLLADKRATEVCPVITSGDVGTTEFHDGFN